ncbi:MAG TPA: Hsp70 family protein [Actinomycetota bacterium]|jgi:molecular chaperone DnaK|nr:Hsp70 family protein [Actinomycetota bacterium]
MSTHGQSHRWRSRGREHVPVIGEQRTEERDGAPCLVVQLGTSTIRVAVRETGSSTDGKPVGAVLAVHTFFAGVERQDTGLVWDVDPRGSASAVSGFLLRVDDAVPVCVGGQLVSAAELVAAQIDAVTDVVASQHGQPSRVMVVHPDDLSRTALTRITEAMSNPDRIVWVSRGRDALDRCSSIPSDGESLEPQVTGLVHIGGRSTQATLWTDEPSSRRVGETITIEGYAGHSLDDALLVLARAAAERHGVATGSEPSDPRRVRTAAAARQSCAQAKHRLSIATTAEVEIDADRVRVVRADLRGAVCAVADRAQEVLDEAILSAGLGRAALGRVVLMGGSSHVPAVAEEISLRMGVPVEVSALLTAEHQIGQWGFADSSVIVEGSSLVPVAPSEAISCQAVASPRVKVRGRRRLSTSPTGTLRTRLDAMGQRPRVLTASAVAVVALTLAVGPIGFISTSAATDLLAERLHLEPQDVTPISVASAVLESVGKTTADVISAATAPLTDPEETAEEQGPATVGSSAWTGRAGVPAGPGFGTTAGATTPTVPSPASTNAPTKSSTTPSSAPTQPSATTTTPPAPTTTAEPSSTSDPSNSTPPVDPPTGEPTSTPSPTEPTQPTEPPEPTEPPAGEGPAPLVPDPVAP